MLLEHTGVFLLSKETLDFVTSDLPTIYNHTLSVSIFSITV